MIGLDSNVVVRYLVRDDEAQAAASARFLNESCTAADPAYLDRVVLCEVFWVLSRAYGYSREQIATAIEALLRTAQITVDCASLVWTALEAYRTDRADFADTLIGLSNAEAGCSTTVTLDRKAARLPTFKLLK